MSDMVHISSAILRVDPPQAGAVAQAVAAMPDCEVALAAEGKLIVLIEGPSSGAVGARLTEMALLEGVHSACMVYEQIETLQSLGEGA